jgi:hypothetical protein
VDEVVFSTVEVGVAEVEDVVTTLVEEEDFSVVLLDVLDSVEDALDSTEDDDEVAATVVLTAVLDAANSDEVFRGRHTLRLAFLDFTG